jgi:hypothetical protein
MRRSPNTSIIRDVALLDPRNECAPAFCEQAVVISRCNMQLPNWLLTFEELSEVLRDLLPNRNLRARLGAIGLDLRHAFMFGSLTVYAAWPES